MSEAAPATIGHNKPPVILPKDDEWLAEMKRKYPEVEKELPELDKSFATYAKPDGTPIPLTLKDGDVAGALTDLIDQAKKKKKAWKAYAASEKSPLTKLTKVITNFFTTPDEKIEAHLAKYEPVVQDYLDLVEDDKERQRQAEIARQEAAAETARAAAAEEQRKAETARLAAEEERKKEQAAREAAEQAKRDQEAAEQRAAAAKAEEKRLADEKRERDNAEKEKNATSIRDIKSNMKTAERLNDLAEAEEATEAETKNLDMLVRAGGIVGNMAAEIFYSTLLDDEQKAYLTEVRARLGALRITFNERFNKRERAKRAKAAAEAEAREAALVEERRVAKESADAELVAAKARRAEEDAAAETARQAARDANTQARTSREAARTHEKDAKDADKGAAKAEDTADRAENRADRLDSRGPAKAQSRGELGALGTKARSWKHYVDDEAAIRATLGPLGPHLDLDAIKSAAFWYMRAHQAGFQGERVLPKELPGVRFSLVEDLRT